jgi:hypothetical protein
VESHRHPEQHLQQQQQQQPVSRPHGELASRARLLLVVRLLLLLMRWCLHLHGSEAAAAVATQLPGLLLQLLAAAAGLQWGLSGAGR